MTGSRIVALPALLTALLLVAARVEAAQLLAGCPKGLKAHSVAEMIFGRNIGDAVAGVSDDAWARFLDEVVTPRFPGGFTVMDAAGQWWDAPAGRVVREPSKLLMVVLNDEAAQLPRLGEITAEYKRRFSQKSVLLMMRRACAAF